MEEQLLDVDGVARLLGVSRSRIYKLTMARVIPCRYLNGQTLRFLKSEVLEWAESQPRQRARRQGVR